MQRGSARWAKQLGGADGLGEGVLEERLSGEAGREHFEGEIEKDGWKGRRSTFIYHCTQEHLSSLLSPDRQPGAEGSDSMGSLMASERKVDHQPEPLCFSGARVQVHI